jgi:hypothetical protein
MNNMPKAALFSDRAKTHRTGTASNLNKENRLGVFFNS